MNDKVLHPTQLNILARLETIKLTDHKVQTECLMPQLTAFCKRVSEHNQNIFLLCANAEPEKLLAWLTLPFYSVSHISTNKIIGDFHSVPGGKLHFKKGALFNATANTIIIPASILLQDFPTLELVGKMLLNRQLDTRWLISEPGQVSHKQYRHQTISFDKKVIITGNYDALCQIQYLLPALSRLTFDDIFEADYVAEVNEISINALHQFISQQFGKTLNKPQLDAIIWALARNIEDQHWFSIDVMFLEKLFSRMPDNFTQADVEMTVHDLSGFHSSARLFNFEQIRNDTVKVDFTGEVVGQINGLTVVETALAEFGEPSRITANIFIGEGDISDIERKSDLGGNIHAKAMMILSSFVSQVFAKNEPLPISSNVVFEQSYHEVDGDSASLAELYALLSAIANIPIRQNVALTGAIDQLGNVLAVGGVDLKIEGYHTLAKLKAPFETHHVIIPKANIANLNLSSEVCASVEQGKLQIHAIDHVTQACEILTGIPAETEEQTGLFDKVRVELEKFSADYEEKAGIFVRFLRFFTNLR
ncbi:S16 family serine protease [Catenovulum sediminis]|uniref:S16 family serine protease n=1 Tax=Catenovulum sediminis TaxID=1740262 RepID=UPI00117D4FBE|nr:S16 family serine protease [Catenovulum sediminis]